MLETVRAASYLREFSFGVKSPLFDPAALSDFTDFGWKSAALGMMREREARKLFVALSGDQNLSSPT